MRCKFNGEAFHSVRKSKKCSQASIAESAGTSIRYVGALERGEKTNPSADMVSRFSMVLEVPVENLMTTSDEE